MIVDYLKYKVIFVVLVLYVHVINKAYLLYRNNDIQMIHKPFQTVAGMLIENNFDIVQ